MIDARFVPIDKWPGKATAYYDRKAAPFRAAYAATLDLLEKELNQLGAKDITIQAYFERRDIRNDGWPRSSARPSQPGVIVGFDIRKSKWDPEKRRYVDELVRSMSFPCDRFKSWEDNLRAIALALEALRKVDRYGVTQSGEQYQGWAKLPPATDPSEMTREEAALFIAGYANTPKDYILGDQAQLEYAYRIAAKALHPDTQSGNHELFLRLQAAKAVLSR